MKTVLTITDGEQKISIEIEEPTGIDMCNAFFAACVGMTYAPSSILNAMKEYYEEYVKTFEILNTEKNEL